MRLPILTTALLAALLSGRALAGGRGAEGEPSAAPPAWEAGTLDLAARLPVQDEGRIKPLSTMASFAMLRIHHKRTFRDGSGRKVEPTEWLLNAILHPDAARHERIFTVENRDALDAIGLPRTGKGRRDRYSYNELAPARLRLLQLGQEYSGLEEADRTPVQGQIVLLGQNVLEFEGFLRYLDFAGGPVPVAPALVSFFDGRQEVPVSEAVRVLPDLLARGRQDKEVGQALTALMRDLDRRARGARALALFPPVGSLAPNEAWLTPRDLVQRAGRGQRVDPQHLAMLAALEEVAAQRDDPAGLATALRTLHERTRRAAEARGEYEKIDLEVFYYRLDPFYRGLVLYLLAFLLVAVTWIKPDLKWLNRSVVALLAGGLALNVTGIVLRCILRGRPPVSTLYETLVFIAAVSVLTAMVMERINRRRIAIAAAPLLGALCLFLAMRYEELNRADTMPRLVAVLDTNFWLAAHVTCITIGYAAALLASALAHVHIFGRAFGLKKNDAGFYHGLTRMTYGVLCFALLFNVVGTILGGVWANESWGRFWGWDPKENGALMIVLAQLAIVHGRLGGYLRGPGIAMAAVFQGAVVAFSWWGVNLLGVGLHTYGYAQGIWNSLLAFYLLEALVLAVAIATWFRKERTPTQAAAAQAESA